jgi:Kef-type K+ transport system membrane component KefB
MLVLSAGALALGLVPLYGAFVAGITVAVATEGDIVPERNALSSFSFGFFIPIYFAIIGLQLDLIHHFAVVFFLGFLAFACAVKGASVYLGARLSRENNFMSASLAIAMNARGGPGIVLASTAYAAGIINQTFFVSLVMLSIVTSLLAGSWLERVADRITGQQSETDQASPDDQTENQVGAAGKLTTS